MTISIDPILETTSVRPVRSLEIGRLSRALTQAFWDDPVFEWFWPRPKHRLARIERFFRAIALERLTLPHGHVYTTEALAGGALWVPPGEAGSSASETLEMLPEVLRSSGRHVVRSLRGQAAFESHHPHEDHWYLMFVGVAPEWRGMGLGTALMQSVLDRADAEGMPAYLDATSPRNRRLYERHGFDVTEEYRLPGGGPPLWSMWRDPA